MHSALPAQRIDEAQQWVAPCLGCGLLLLGSYLKIPFYPVSFTMQTCALWMIAIAMPRRQAVLSVLLYLGLATVGFPVFGGHANPLWMLGKSAGYLIGFLLAVYLVASFCEKKTFLAALVTGHFVIYLLGFLGLLPFIGVKAAWWKGVAIFLPSDVLKTVIACVYKEKIHDRFF